MSKTINHLGKKVLTEIEDGGIGSLFGGRDEMVRLGVVGAGRHARANLWPCLSSLPVIVPAVCTAHKSSAERWGQRLGATSFYDDPLAMIEHENLHAVLACVGPEVHSTLIPACLSHGLPLFVEKPVCLSAKHAKELATHDSEHRIVVGFQKRFAPAYSLVRESIDKKRMGGLDSLHLELCVGPLPGGLDGFMREVGIHFVDLARFFTSDIKIVSVRKKSPSDEIHQVLAHFEAGDGVVGSLFLSSGFGWADCRERVMACFRRGTITVEDLLELEVSGHSRSLLGVPLDKIAGGRRYRRRWQPNLIAGSAQNSSQTQAGFLPELAHFIRDVVINNKPSASSLNNAAQSQSLGEQLASV